MCQSHAGGGDAEGFPPHWIRTVICRKGGEGTAFEHVRGQLEGSYEAKDSEDDVEDDHFESQHSEIEDENSKNEHSKDEPSEEQPSEEDQGG